MNRSTIFYTGRFEFPDREAGARRVLGIGLALRMGGFNVVFAGTEDSGRIEDQQDDGTFVYQGFRYVPDATGAAPKSRSHVSHWVDFHLGGLTALRRLRMLDPASLRAIVVYNGPSLLLWKLLAYGRKYGVPVIADTSEWYDPRQITWGRMNPTWLDSEIRMRVMQVKFGNVLAISRHLKGYYERAGCHVLHVPPLVNMVEADLHGQRGPMGRGPSAVLQLAYAGVPGRKDLIGNAIRSLSLLGGAAQQVRLMLIGPTAAEARCLLGADGALLDKHASRVTCRGRCSHNEALSLVAAADFTVLLRPDVRFTRAGFPSKFVESLSLGVPLIANLTGDISSHLTDGREGIVLEAATPEACRDGIRRILAMPRWHWQEMRERARSRAVTSFAYERFAGDLCRFVEKTRIVP